MSLTEKELEKVKKQFGLSCERYFTYGMPERSLFWVSKEQVSSSFDDELEEKNYLSLLGNRGLTQTKQKIYTEKYPRYDVGERQYGGFYRIIKNERRKRKWHWLHPWKTVRS